MNYLELDIVHTQFINIVPCVLLRINFRAPVKLCLQIVTESDRVLVAMVVCCCLRLYFMQSTGARHGFRTIAGN